MKNKGVVAAGHEETAKAAEIILREGGNAFDAALAAHFTACVAEPVLSSLGGGGFLLAHSADGNDVLYDFFVQTPKRKRLAEDIDFYPISADFGTVQQEFHIGNGAIATPGTVKGLAAVHRDLCSMPMTLIVEPACALARNGVVVNPFQAYIFDIVGPIYRASQEAFATFGTFDKEQRLLQQGELLRLPELADCMDAIAREGADLFYRGEIAQRITRLCQHGGGHLSPNDLEAYQIIQRTPLRVGYRNASLLSNPPPSSGGILIAFAMKMVENAGLADLGFGSAAHLGLLANVMDMTNKARIEAHLDDQETHVGLELLDPGTLSRYKAQIKGNPSTTRGTTQISVMDSAGNIASLTTSNGEGCGRMVPNTGFMLNNMLGEEDLNPQGFCRWPTDRRMTSMMAPSIIVLPNGRSIALGSGGSNRLRTAILQVLINLLDFKMPVIDAVNSPRIHFEADQLNIEDGFEESAVRHLLASYSNHSVWNSKNLYFGGAHSVERHNNYFSGAGDPRRGGVARIV